MHHSLPGNIVWIDKGIWSSWHRHGSSNRSCCCNDYEIKFEGKKITLSHNNKSLKSDLFRLSLITPSVTSITAWMFHLSVHIFLWQPQSLITIIKFDMLDSHTTVFTSRKSKRYKIFAGVYPCRLAIFLCFGGRNFCHKDSSSPCWGSIFVIFRKWRLCI